MPTTLFQGAVVPLAASTQLMGAMALLCPLRSPSPECSHPTQHCPSTPLRYTHSWAPAVPRGQAGESWAGRGAVNHGQRIQALHNQPSWPQPTRPAQTGGLRIGASRHPLQEAVVDPRRAKGAGSPQKGTKGGRAPQSPGLEGLRAPDLFIVVGIREPGDCHEWTREPGFLTGMAVSDRRSMGSSALSSWGAIKGMAMKDKENVVSSRGWSLKGQGSSSEGWSGGVQGPESPHSDGREGMKEQVSPVLSQGWQWRGKGDGLLIGIDTMEHSPLVGTAASGQQSTVPP